MRAISWTFKTSQELARGLLQYNLLFNIILRIPVIQLLIINISTPILTLLKFFLSHSHHTHTHTHTTNNKKSYGLLYDLLRAYIEVLQYCSLFNFKYKPKNWWFIFCFYNLFFINMFHQKNFLNTIITIFKYFI